MKTGQAVPEKKTFNDYPILLLKSNKLISQNLLILDYLIAVFTCINTQWLHSYVLKRDK